MKNRAKNIIDIVPLTRIPLSRNQSFSYLSEQEIKKGTLVSIPLFKRKVEGIVLGARPDFPRLGNIELKKVAEILEEDFLDARQLELAKFISDYYISPLGIVLKSFVPRRVKERKPKPKTYNPQPKTQNSIILTDAQQKAVDAIANLKFKIKNLKFYLFGPSGAGKTEIYIHAVVELRKKIKNLQSLILVPELTLTPQAIERYGAYFRSEETVVLHSRISKGQFYSSWKKIRSGEAKIIIGSRMAVFAPFKALGLVVVDEEQDMSFKQWDMNPRYDARTVAEKLAELHGARIVFGSATPSVESFYRAVNKEYKLLTLPQFGQKQWPETIIADMRKERWKNWSGGPANFSPISKKLQGEISYALKNGFQAILFVNRQGMSQFSVCAGCKTVLKCPKCGRALIYDSQGIYKCVHCAHKTSITPQCSKCKGLNFTNIGLGTQKIEKEIANLFPAARIARADNQTMREPKYHEKIYEDFSAGKVDILIGTQVISKGWDLPNVGLVGIIDADNLLSIPDFSSSIRAYQHIVQVSGRTGRPNSKIRGVVIIQTFNPENFVFKTAAERDFKKFFSKEIEERKELAFPPIGKFIKLIFQDYDQKNADTEARRIYDFLKDLNLKNTLIAPPQSALASNVRGRWRKQILIKLKGHKRTELPDKLRQALNGLPAGWIIDVDPISII